MMEKLINTFNYIGHMIELFKAKKAENHKILIKGTVLDTNNTTNVIKGK